MLRGLLMVVPLLRTFFLVLPIGVSERNCLWFSADYPVAIGTPIPLIAKGECREPSAKTESRSAESGEKETFLYTNGLPPFFFLLL